MSANNRAAYLLLLAVTVIWGYTWVAQKLGLHYMGPFSFPYFVSASAPSSSSDSSC